MPAIKNEQSVNANREPGFLTPQTQKAVLEDIRQVQAATAKSFRRAALWTGIGIAAMAAAPLLGLGALPVMAAGIVAFMGGSKLLREAARGLSLRNIAKNVKSETFVPDLKARAGRRMAQASTAATVSNNTFYATLALSIGLFIPPVAAAAGALYGIAVLGTIVTMGIADGFRGAKEAAMTVAKSAYTHRVAEGAIRPAEDALPPALSLAPAPAPDFKVAANGNVKPQNLVRDAAPPKPGVPKL